MGKKTALPLFNLSYPFTSRLCNISDNDLPTAVGFIAFLTSAPGHCLGWSGLDLDKWTCIETWEFLGGFG